MTETEQPQTNGLDGVVEEDENNITRPADIEQDMREMERRKRVEAIMCSRLFREELERIVDGQLKDGPSTIMQQLSDMMGVPVTKVGNIFRGSSCVIPINDIRGVEAMGYEKGEKILRCKLAATFRLLEYYGYSAGIQSIVTARLNADQELFLVNPYGLLFHEVTASSLNKVNMQGFITEQGTTNFGINTSQFILHSVIHAARPDIRCIINVGHNAVVAVSSTKQGLLPVTKDAAVLGEIAIHNYSGALNEPEEREKLVRSLGPMSKVLLLTNHGALCCGETIEEAFYEAQHIVKACEAQLNLLPAGIDNLVLIPEETRKAIYDASRKPPESIVAQDQTDNKDKPAHHQGPKWRVGGAEFEAMMRMMDNAGFRTGYIYRNPLVKHEVPKPKNDIEVPPAVSSLGYLLEEEELYRQGIWKKGMFKAGDRTRWLNSPNVYQKVEVLETGTSDPKKITKWVDTQAEEWVVDGSPTHSTPVKIDSALQFVPTNTNPKEFKRIQQQIKDYRRADKISAGPQSHILEGVTWDEANRLKDANVTKTGDHVVLMGAASKGIIQRGYQHNATVYKAPYAKNPFDSVTDDELNEYKRTVEKKRTGDYTDTDFSESEALSSLPVSGQVKSPVMSPPSQSEPEDAEHVVMRIETKQAPKPSQPEVVLSDVNADFLSNEKYESVVTGKPPKKGKEHNTNIDGQRKNKKVICSLSDLSGTLNSKLVKSKRSNSNNSIQPEPFFSPIPTQTKCFNWLSENLPDLDFMSCKSTSHSNTMYKYCDTFPYRTNSHFGFNSPSYKDPQHYHLPCSPNKFVPLRRSKSFEELFCTDRYLSLPGGQIPLKILSAIRRKFASPQNKSKSSRVLFKDETQKPSAEKSIQTDSYMHDVGTQCQEQEWIESSIYYDSCPTMANSDYSLSDDTFMLTASAPPSIGGYAHRTKQDLNYPKQSKYTKNWNEFVESGRQKLLESMLDSNELDDNKQDIDNCGAVPVYRTYAEFFDSGPENGFSGDGTLSAQTSNLSMQTVIENMRLNSSSSREFMEKCIGVEDYPMLDDERLTLISETSRNPTSLVSGPNSLLENSPPLNEVEEEQPNSLESVSSVHSGHDYKNCTKCEPCLNWQKWYNSGDSKEYKRKRKQAALERKNREQASEKDEEIVTLDDDENPTSDHENVWTFGTSSNETTPRNSNDTIVNVDPINITTIQAEVHPVPNRLHYSLECPENCSSCATNDGFRKRYLNVMQDAYKFAEENFVPKDYTPTKSKYSHILAEMKIIPNILKRKLSPCSRKLLADVNVKLDDYDDLDDTLVETEVQVTEESRKSNEVLERIEEVDENIIASRAKSPLELKLERKLAQVLKEAEEERKQKSGKSDRDEIQNENFEEIVSVTDDLSDTDIENEEETNFEVLFDRNFNEQTLNTSREDTFWKDAVSETENKKSYEQDDVIDLSKSQDDEYFEDSLDVNLNFDSKLPTIVINDSNDSQIENSLESSEVYEFEAPDVQQKNSTPEESAEMGDLVELTPISPVRKSLVHEIDKKLEELNNQKCGETFMKKIQDFNYSKESPVIVTGNEILANPDTVNSPIEAEMNDPDEYSKVWEKIPFINFNHSNGIDRVLNERESVASSFGNGPDLSANVENVTTENNPEERAENKENLDAGTDFVERNVCTSTPEIRNTSHHSSHISISSDESEVKSFHTPQLLHSMEEKKTKLFDLNNSKENIDVDGYFSDVSDTRYSNRYNKRSERKHFRHSLSKSVLSKNSIPRQKPKRNFIDENVKRIACISASKISNAGSIFCKTNPFKTTTKRNDMISSFQSQKQKLWVTFNAERKPLSQKHLGDNTITPNKTPVSGKKIAKKMVETPKMVNSGIKQKTPKSAIKTDAVMKSTEKLKPKEKSNDDLKMHKTPTTSKPLAKPNARSASDMTKIRKVNNGNGRKSTNRRNSMRLLKAKNILKVPKSVADQTGTMQDQKVPNTPVGIQVTPKAPRVNLDDYSTPKTISPVRTCPHVSKKTGSTPICENRKIRRRIFDVNEQNQELKKTPQKSAQKTLPNSSGNPSKSSTAPKIVKMILKPTVKPTIDAEVLEAQRRFIEGEAADTVSLASTSSDRSVRIEMFRNAFMESEKRMSEIAENAHFLCKELDGITFEKGFKTSTESSTEFLELERKMNERLSEQVDNRHRMELLWQLQDKQILEQQRQYIEDESKIRTNQLSSLDEISGNLAKCLSSKDGLVGKLDDKIKKLDSGIGECVKIQSEMEEDRCNVENCAGNQLLDGMDFGLKENDD